MTGQGQSGVIILVQFNNYAYIKTYNNTKLEEEMITDTTITANIVTIMLHIILCTTFPKLI